MRSREECEMKKIKYKIRDGFGAFQPRRQGGANSYTLQTAHRYWISAPWGLVEGSLVLVSLRGG